MGMAPKTQVEITEFNGMISNNDPIDRGPGDAQDQVNTVSITPGELQVRRGYRQVTFEN